MDAERSGDKNPLTVSHQFQVTIVLSPRKWFLVSVEWQTGKETERV
jgi:hypothetical protein